ncbi:MAG: hypothetical protein VKO65_00475 [Cyanobacteriota bacterium]|nr:hypothetical protein [Cyanobacteriota bacterium]
MASSLWAGESKAAPLCPPESLMLQDLRIDCLYPPVNSDQQKPYFEFTNPEPNHYALTAFLNVSLFYRFHATYRYDVDLGERRFDRMVFGSIVDLSGGGWVHVYKSVYDPESNTLLSFSHSTNGEPVSLSGLSGWPSKLLIEDWILGTLPVHDEHPSTLTAYYTTFVEAPGPHPAAPAPLPVLGAAAALAFSRRLRSRIRASRSE